MIELAGYPMRTKNAVWRDIAGEIVIVEDDGATVRLLNKTASYIWTLADGTRRLADIGEAVCSGFDITPDQALADTEEFCRQLYDAGLISLDGAPLAT